MGQNNNAHNQLQAYIDPNRVLTPGVNPPDPGKAPKAKAAATPAASPTSTPGGFATVTVGAAGKQSKGTGMSKPTSAQTQAAQGFFTGLNATIDQQNGTGTGVPTGPVVDSEEPALQGNGAAALGEAAENLAESAKGVADKVGGWAETLPTPGGIALLVVILLAFLWAVVPVNGGKTRAQLLYYVLMEKSILKPPDGLVPGLQGFPGLADIQGAGQYNVGGGAGTTSTSGAVGGGGGNYTAPITQSVSLNPNVPYVPDFSQF